MNRPLLQLPRLTSRLALKLPHLSLRRSLNTQVITETTRTVAGANIPPLPLSAPIDAVSASPISELALAGLGSSYTPVGWIQLLLDQIHTTAEMPWIPTIVVATLVLRLLLLPLTLKGQRAAAKLASIQHLVKPLNDEMQRLKKNGDTQGASLQAGKLRTLFVEHKVNPLAGLVQILQIPVLISAFLGVKSMAENLPSFSDPAAGMGWITNLSVADPTGVLPVVGSLGMLAGIELSTRLAPQAGVAAGGGMIWVMRVMSIVSIPFMSYLPSAVFVYTITAAVATLFQTAILHNKRVRKILNLPPVAGGDGQAPAKGMLGIKLMPKDVINRAIKDTKTRRILNQKLVHDGANSRNAADQKLKSSNA